MLLRLGAALLALVLATGGLALPSAGAAVASAEPTRVALAVPITVPPETTGLIPAEILEIYTSPSGILTRQLSAVFNRPVAIGIDPMIIASIRILGTSAPESATAWLERLTAAGNEIFALSYADSDIAALAQAGSVSILEPTAFVIDPDLFPEAPVEEEPVESDAPEQTATPTPSPTTAPQPPTDEIPTSETLTDWPYTLDSIAWPRAATVTANDLTSFNANAPVTTILASGNIAARSSASAAVGEHSALISDDTLSELLDQATGALTDAEWQLAMEGIETAVAGWSGGGAAASGSLFATFARNPTGSTSRLAETLTALALMPQLSLTHMSDVVAEPQAAVRLAEQAVDAERVSRLRLLLAAEALIAPFAEMLADPTLITGERRLSLLALNSNSWLGSEAGWSQAVDDWLARSNAILNSVQVAESSPINFVQDKGNLPISISNDLDYAVTVYVTVRTDTGILVVLDRRVPIVVEPNSQSRALIPVQSIANGEATLQVSLSTENRVAVSVPKQVTTNVIAGWETAATFVIAGLLLIVFTAGIVRTVLRRRRLNEEAAQSSENGPLESSE